MKERKRRKSSKNTKRRKVDAEMERAKRKIRKKGEKDKDGRRDTERRIEGKRKDWEKEATRKKKELWTLSVNTEVTSFLTLLPRRSRPYLDRVTAPTALPQLSRLPCRR